MRNNRMIPICEPYIGKEELMQLTNCIDTKWLSGGNKVKEFEQRMSSLCNTKFAVACSNGTVALYIGLLALGIGKGDEVLVPDFTFIASANAVTWTGARPIFVDIDSKTYNIDCNDARRKITKRTKAIMPVHIYGQSANMDDILDLTLEYELKVIEDAAQGIGVKWNGLPVGGLGDVGCLSFYADKVITSGEGGMVITNNEEIAKKCLILKHQGRTGRGWYVHDYIGFNFRMTDMQAGIGIAQLQKLDSIIKIRRDHDELYRHNLKNIAGLELTYTDKRSFNVPFRHNILVDKPDELQKYLEDNGIQTRRFFYPLHKQPCYNKKGKFPNSINAYEHGLSLPCATSLKNEDIEFICDKIRGFMK